MRIIKRKKEIEIVCSDIFHNILIHKSLNRENIILHFLKSVNMFLINYIKFILHLIFML